MRVLITGCDGYEGWPLALYMRYLGHEVVGVDNLSRRKWVEECGACSAIPIPSAGERIAYARLAGFDFRPMAVGGDRFVGLIQEFQPEVVIHLAEQPSAPYSMMPGNAVFTAQNNFCSTVSLLDAMRQHAPRARLVYVSTMGEYGTPEIPIPEGVFGADAFIMNGFLRQTTLVGLSAPRSPGSIYHVSKAASSFAVAAAVRMWGLAATTLYQGVVYGLDHPAAEAMGKDNAQTRFDVDEAFGTVFNRFCAQAVLGIPLTVYGKGGQTRGFISLWDTVASIAAIAEKPGFVSHEHCNQIAELCSVFAMADIVVRAAKDAGIEAHVEHVPNPRVESEDHEYVVCTDCFRRAYPKPATTLKKDAPGIIAELRKNYGVLEGLRGAVAPKTAWRGKV